MIKTSTLLTTLALALTLPLSGQVGWVWGISAGANSFDAGSRITSDLNNNCYVTGYFTDTITFGSTQLIAQGLTDAYVAKIDQWGSPVWARRYGGTTPNDEGRGIGTDVGGNVYVSGMFEGSVSFGSFTLNSGTKRAIFLIKIDGTNGNVVWAKMVTSPQSQSAVHDLVTDALGNVFITGQMDTKMLFNPGTIDSIPLLAAGGGIRDIFVAKFDNAGKALWAKSAGSNSFDAGWSIALDPAGDAIVTGYFSANAVFGSNNINSSGLFDFFLAKYSNLNGNCVWAKAAGQSASGDDYANGVAVDAAGNIYMIGEYYVTFGNTDVIVKKFDPSGTTMLWSKTVTGAGLGYGTDISVASYFVWFTGSFAGTTSFGGNNKTATGAYDAYLAHYDTSGSFVGVYTGYSVNVGGAALATDASGTYAWVTGSFSGTGTFATFGNKFTATNKGQTDMFAALFGFGVSVEEKMKLQEHLNVFPNPSDNGVFGVMTDPAERILEIEVLNLVGDVVMRFQNTNIADISALPRGMYFLRVKDSSEKIRTGKVIY